MRKAEAQENLTPQRFLFLIRGSVQRTKPVESSYSICSRRSDQDINQAVAHLGSCALIGPQALRVGTRGGRQPRERCCSISKLCSVFIGTSTFMKRFGTTTLAEHAGVRHVTHTYATLESCQHPGWTHRWLTVLLFQFSSIQPTSTYSYSHLHMHVHTNHTISAAPSSVYYLQFWWTKCKDWLTWTGAQSCSNQLATYSLYY